MLWRRNHIYTVFNISISLLIQNQFTQVFEHKIYKFNSNSVTTGSFWKYVEICVLNFIFKIYVIWTENNIFLLQNVKEVCKTDDINAFSLNCISIFKLHSGTRYSTHKWNDAGSSKGNVCTYSRLCCLYKISLRLLRRWAMLALGQFRNEFRGFT